MAMQWDIHPGKAPRRKRRKGHRRLRVCGAGITTMTMPMPIKYSTRYNAPICCDSIPSTPSSLCIALVFPRWSDFVKRRVPSVFPTPKKLPAGINRTRSNLRRSLSLFLLASLTLSRMWKIRQRNVRLRSIAVSWTRHAELGIWATIWQASTYPSLLAFVRMTLSFIHISSAYGTFDTARCQSCVHGMSEKFVRNVHLVVGDRSALNPRRIIIDSI